MRTGRLWFGASLGMALLLGSYGLKAQELIPSPRGRIAPPAGLPSTDDKGHKAHDDHKHDEHEHEHEEGEEGEDEKVGGLIVEADFLLLRPRRRPHDFAIIDSEANRTLGGSVVNFDWKTVGAYRLALGWKLNHGWEMKGTYTYVHSNDEAAISRPPNGELFATLSAPLTFDSALSARGSSNLDMDLIDGEFAKRWVPCEDFWLRVSGGVRVATIGQKTNVFYDLSDAGFGGSNVGQRIQFDGVGPRVGAEGFWKLCGEHIGLWAKAYSALMSGDFNTTNTQFVNDGRTVILDVHNKFWKVVPNVELGVGLGWQSEHVSFKLGYEMQNFFGLVDIPDFPDQATYKNNYRTGDLSLEALTFSMGVYY